MGIRQKCSNRSGGKAVIRALNHRFLPTDSAVRCRNYGGRLINRGARSLPTGGQYVGLCRGSFNGRAPDLLTEWPTETGLDITGESESC